LSRLWPILIGHNAIFPPATFPASRTASLPPPRRRLRQERRVHAMYMRASLHINFVTMALTAGDVYSNPHRQIFERRSKTRRRRMSANALGVVIRAIISACACADRPVERERHDPSMYDCRYRV